MGLFQVAQFNCTVNIVCFQLTLNHFLSLIPQELIPHLNDFFSSYCPSMICMIQSSIYSSLLKYSLTLFMVKCSNRWGANTVFIERHKKQWKVFLVVFLPCLFRNLTFELHLFIYLLWSHEQNLFQSYYILYKIYIFCVIIYRHMNFLHWRACEFLVSYEQKKNSYLARYQRIVDIKSYDLISVVSLFIENLAYFTPKSWGTLAEVSCDGNTTQAWRPEAFMT